MPHLSPLGRQDVPELEGVLREMEGQMGFVANSLLTMARKPDIVRALVALARATLGPGSVDRGLKQLVALMSSQAAGCQYCQAHNVSQANRVGVSGEKIEALWEFERDPTFTPAERGALRLARDAAQTPNLVTASHFDILKRYFRDEQIVELMAVIALFGYLNRWNDSLATMLEDEPRTVAETSLSPHGWSVGKHDGDTQ